MPYKRKEDQGLNHGMAVLYVSATVVEVVAGSDVEAVPITLYHFIGAVVVMMPGGKDKLGSCVAERLKQLVLVLLRPSVVVVHITPEIGRVTVDDVPRLRPLNGFGEGHIVKLPFLLFDDAGHMLNLIAYFRDVGRSKAVRLLAKRDVPVTVPVEAHHPVEARPGEKDEIVWTVLRIESFAHFTEMSIASLVGLGKQPAFLFKISPHRVRCDLTALHTPIELPASS